MKKKSKFTQKYVEQTCNAKKVYETFNDAQSHIRNIKGKGYRCPVCDKWHVCGRNMGVKSRSIKMKKDRHYDENSESDC
jgi:hypothetical protein